MSITLTCIKTSCIKLYEKMHYGRRPADQKSKPEVNLRDVIKWMSVWSISVLISVTIADIWTKFYIELQHHTINMTECSKCTRLENPRWWRPPYCISENVNNSELDRELFAQKNWWADASWPCAGDTWPKLETGTFLCDVIIITNKDVYIKRMSGT